MSSIESVGIKIDVNTSGLDVATRKVEALTSSVKALEPGLAMIGGSFAVDPLESAIDQTVRLISECQGNQEVRLTNHLDALLAIQIKRVTTDETA